MRGLSISLLVAGIIWTLVVAWIYLTLSGIAEPISVMRVVLYYGGLLLGPLALILGPILVLNGTYAKPGAILAILGCAVLTVFVFYQTAQAMHVEPLQVKPPYALYAVVVILVILADAAAVKLYRLSAVN
ncbi:MAG: hypothetical protein JWO19_1387 [Bryobacterales bacterium]|jgi:hypothetical protein|nr:hypothetical protein [Bryobacterales bacterium]